MLRPHSSCSSKESSWLSSDEGNAEKGGKWYKKTKDKEKKKGRDGRDKKHHSGWKSPLRMISTRDESHAPPARKLGRKEKKEIKVTKKGNPVFGHRRTKSGVNSQTDELDHLSFARKATTADPSSKRARRGRKSSITDLLDDMIGIPSEQSMRTSQIRRETMVMDPDKNVFHCCVVGDLQVSFYLSSISLSIYLFFYCLYIHQSLHLSFYLAL